MPDDYLQTQFEILTNKIRRLNEHKCKTDDVFTEQHRIIQEKHARLPDWAINKEHGERYHFFFRSPSTGADITLEAVPMKLKDQLELNTLQKLKAYHWLLVDAYEAFEVFLVKAYAHCGRESISIWEKPEKWRHHIGSNNIDHYDTERKPFGQLGVFRKNSAHFARYETNSLTDTNYRVTFTLIEKLRQCIVHHGGYFKNLNQLTSNVQGALKDEDRNAVGEYFKSHFIPHRDDNLIDLLEYPSYDDNGTPNGGYNDPMLGYFRALAEYALLIMESIRVHPRTVSV